MLTSYKTMLNSSQTDVGPLHIDFARGPTWSCCTVLSTTLIHVSGCQYKAFAYSETRG